MSRKSIWEFCGILLFLVAATGLIAITGADLAISSKFQSNGKWPVGDLPFWQFFYKMNRGPAIAMALTGLCLAMAGFFKPAWATWKRNGIFLLLLIVLGPGLLVNNVFKQHWGRPRPREVMEFGGQKQFLQPWQKGISGNGRSFPSGHSSAAFAMSAPFFVLRRRRPRLALTWLGGGICFGILMSIARITQGGHFLSDCLWAFGMVYLTGLLLSVAMGLDRDSPVSSS